MMKNIDSVHSHVQSSRQEALLYVFEDNECGASYEGHISGIVDALND